MNKTNWTKKFEKRFWEKVYIPHDIEDDCWIWTAGTDMKDYGRFFVKSNKNIHNRVMSHRLSYEYYNGVILTQEQHVCHKCDNPICVNPHHLFLGNHQINRKDQYLKGRSVKGTKNGRSLLEEEEVKELRKLFNTGLYTKSYLCDLFGISWTCCKNIIDYNTWTHI